MSCLPHNPIGNGWREHSRLDLRMYLWGIRLRIEGDARILLNNSIFIGKKPNLCRINNDLGENIYINHTSLIETAGRASLTYLSTLAVLQLDAILQNARVQFVDKPKLGNKHQAKFEQMLGMSYTCPGIGDVRLMVGVRKRDKTKIQYCITALLPVARIKKSSHTDCS